MIEILKENNIISTADDVDNFLMDNLKYIKDQAFADVLRDIIKNNAIDLKDVAKSIKKHMPETHVEY